MALNLEKQLLFYGAYHHEPTNVFIHIVCVPAILMTSFLMLGHWSGPLFDLSSHPSLPSIPSLSPNIGTLGAFLYSSLYLLMEPVAGAMAAPLIVGGAAAMNHLAATYGFEAVKWAAVVWTASWVLQFVGHGRFEGRAPALLDSLLQAFFLAPLFVWLEVLFMLGYRPELRERINVGIRKEIEKYRREKAANGKGKAKEAS